MLVGLGHVDLVCRDLPTRRSRSTARSSGRSGLEAPAALRGRARRADPLSPLPRAGLRLDRPAAGARGAAVRAVRARPAPSRARGRDAGRRRPRPRRSRGRRRRGAARAAALAAVPPGLLRDVLPRPGRLPARGRSSRDARFGRTGHPLVARMSSARRGQVAEPFAVHDESVSGERGVTSAVLTLTTVEHMFHHMGEMAAESGTQAIDRAAELLVSVVESTRPLGVGELSESAGLPKSTTSRLVGALERRGLVQRAGDRRVAPGPVLLRFAHRDLGASLVEIAAPALKALSQLSGETINLGVPTPLGVEHLAQEDSRHFVGGTNWVGRRVPYESTANGKVLLAFGARPTATRSARAATRPPSTSSSTASPRSPRPSSGPTATRSPPSPSPGRPFGSPATASPSLSRPCSSRPASSRCDSATTTSEVPHDPRRDPQGPLRRDAHRERARGEGPRQQGARGRARLRVDALRRADPVARGGRRALRARRLLRARDADRGARDAGRARHPAPAARRDRREADRHLRHGHRQGRRARHRQEPRQHHARGRRLHRLRPRRQRRARGVRRSRSRSTSRTSSASRRS